MLVREVLEKVLMAKRVGSKRQGTYRNAFASLEKFNEKFPDNGLDINAWVKSMPESYSDETVLTYWKAVGSACKVLEKGMGRNPDGSYRFYNPVKDSDRPLTKKKQRRYYKPEQALSIMKQGRTEVELMLSSVLVSSGCRIGDLDGLRGRHIGDNSFESPLGKTGELIYRCDPRLCESMKRMAGDNEGFVFKSKRRPGCCIPRNSLAKMIRRMTLAAGFTGKKLGPHTFRHSVGNMIAIKTGSGIAVAQQLNQENLKTAQIYIHDAEKQTSRGIDTLGMVNVVPVEQKALVPVEEVGIVERIDLIEDMFERLPENVAVRPKFGSEDLGLLRSVMVDFARANKGDSRVYRCQELLRRMLRRV